MTGSQSNNPSSAPVNAELLSELDAGAIPPRKRLLGNALIKGQVTLLVAPPGLGKSTLSLLQAVAICSGQPLTGEKLYERGRVWIYNNEDSLDELRRRIAAILQHYDIPFEQIKNRLALSSGETRPLVIAKAGRNCVLRSKDVDQCVTEIKRLAITAFVVDPFIETHEVNENSNEQIKSVGQLFREIAWKADCAVMLVHHTAKPPQGSSEGHAGNLNTSRGASALAGIARVVQTVFSMSPKDAQQYGVPEEEKHHYVRLDDAKANFSLITGRATWFRRAAVILPNGDEVGVLKLVDLSKKGVSTDEADAVYESIIRHLVRFVPGDEITLNAAARLLAWGDYASFQKYRETDARNQRRASKKFRELIGDACGSGQTVTTSLGQEGFELLEGGYPVRLRRMKTMDHDPSLFDAMEGSDDD